MFLISPTLPLGLTAFIQMHFEVFLTTRCSSEEHVTTGILSRSDRTREIINRALPDGEEPQSCPLRF